MPLALPDWSITKKAPVVLPDSCPTLHIRPQGQNSPPRALLLAPASAHSASPTVSRLPAFLRDDRRSRGCSSRHWPFHHGRPTRRRRASSQLPGSWDTGVGETAVIQGAGLFMPEGDPQDNLLQSTYGTWGGRWVGTEPGWKGRG